MRTVDRLTARAALVLSVVSLALCSTVLRSSSFERHTLLAGDLELDLGGKTNARLQVVPCPDVLWAFLTTTDGGLAASCRLTALATEPSLQLVCRASPSEAAEGYSVEIPLRDLIRHLAELRSAEGQRRRQSGPAGAAPDASELATPGREAPQQ